MKGIIKWLIYRWCPINIQFVWWGLDSGKYGDQHWYKFFKIGSWKSSDLYYILNYSICLGFIEIRIWQSQYNKEILRKQLMENKGVFNRRSK